MYGRMRVRYLSPQCGAMSFIENVGAKNLQISEEEFNDKMGYVDGKTDIDLFLEEGAAQDEEDQERIMVLEVSGNMGGHSNHPHSDRVVSTPKTPSLSPLPPSLPPPLPPSLPPPFPPPLPPSPTPSLPSSLAVMQ